MKTKKVSQKLTLNKKTIVSLNNSDLNPVKAGGATYTCMFTEAGSCPSDCTCPTDCISSCNVVICCQ